MNNKKALKALPTIAPKVAVIQEADCIVCTKCIRACPVDAILGAAKQMHTIISNECIGCELCVESCPVNCITMLPTRILNDAEQTSKTTQAKQRFNFREFRMQRDTLEKTMKNNSKNTAPSPSEIIQTRKAAIQAALLRVRKKNDA